MSSRRKRKMKEMVEDTQADANDAPPSKKIKQSHNISEQNEQMQSSLFLDEIDIKQFNEIYYGLHESPIIIELNVPSVILKEISEGSTGSIVECDNYTKCKNEILILNQYIKLDDKDRDFYYHYDKILDSQYNIDIYNKHQIFCKHCTSNLLYCQWKRREKVKTYYCSKKFVNPNIKCICGKNIETLCEDHRICEYCKQSICSQIDVSLWFTRCNGHAVIDDVNCPECGGKYPFCKTMKKEMNRFKFCQGCMQYICKDCIVAKCRCDKYFHHKSCTMKPTKCGCNEQNCMEYVCVGCGDESVHCSKCDVVITYVCKDHLINGDWRNQYRLCLECKQ